MPHRRLVALLAAAAVLVAGTVSFLLTRRDDDSSARPDRALAEAAYQRVLPGLCETVARVEVRDVNGAKAVFVDDVHQALHILSADVMGDDRALATRLLEAKATVERDFDQASVTKLAEDLPPLLATTRASLAALDRTVPDPCA